MLQGFPKELAKKVDGVIEEIHLLKQTGNAMTVNTIEAVARELFKTLKQTSRVPSSPMNKLRYICDIEIK